MILGFYKPVNGSVKIGQYSTSNVSRFDLVANIGVVSQYTFLISGNTWPSFALIPPDTIMENVRLGRLNATNDEVVEAAKKAELHHFILGMSDGYSTLVNDKSLSGGQKQRIGIARCILRDAPILVLDEPTSALDSLTGKAISAMLSALGKVIIVWISLILSG